MEIKCGFDPYKQRIYHGVPPLSAGSAFCGRMIAAEAGKCADVYIKRPIADKNAIGLLGLIRKRVNTYTKNISHTYQHKIVFALIEKEIFGHNSIDSLTHDLDKLILYCLGFPKSFVTDFHRKHSEHHVESGKKPNLRSMLCDNIASSPEFKPEKTLSVRDYFNSSKSLQSVDGFREMLIKHHFGEDINFEYIKTKQKTQTQGGFILAALRTLMLLSGIF